MGAALHIIHLALGGCLKAPPVTFGITADTGGHIAYVLEAAAAQSLQKGVDAVSVYTRLFDDPELGTAHARRSERLGPKLTIERIVTNDRRYLEKEELAGDLAAFAEAFCRHLAALPRLPDVIHAHFADAADIASTARARFGIPFVYTPHALGIDKRRQGFAGDALEARITAERAAISHANAIIVSTRDEADRQIGGYGITVADRVHCLPPGVPQRAAPTGEATLADHLDAWFDDASLPILLAIARPVRKKNLAALLRAYAADPALRAAANLVILAGQHDHATGEERAVLEELATLAADPALAGKVALPARHDASDVAALYTRASRGGVFVNPALHEPFGLTVIEAAAAGVPVVATHSGGPVEIVAALGHGMLVDPRDEGAIADACRAVISDADHHAALAASAVSRIGWYSWERYAASSLAVYRAAGQPRLLASDIDNTLTGCAESARAFAAWAETRDMPFVVATGRSFEEANHVLGAWGLPRPDAYIVDVGTRIMRRDGDGNWRACADYAALLDRDWDRDGAARALAGLSLTEQPPTVQTRHKMSFFGDSATTAAIRRALADAGVAARVIFSHGHLIDVLAPAGGKAAAIAAYAAGLGLPMSACIAAGDSGNDADMLAACGHAIVVANADADLDHLAPRPGLHRTAGRHAAGVLEGLALYGLALAPMQVAA
ncbi:HAD-IIB family hydrolase [uncultured Sphingomonas sp.]|uniref:HAD-IIB family hydrolase n=1 Tax=uncultured Sphingomonas sp. TaxID=158754 RepID=UPI0026247CC6|nr:HAD-IIB family hydrolase [uncultured Sphingomonas sp.]